MTYLTSFVRHRVIFFLLCILLVQGTSAQDMSWEPLGLNEETVFSTEIRSDGSLLAGGREKVYQWSHDGIWAGSNFRVFHTGLYDMAELPDGTIYTGDGLRLYLRRPGDTTWTESYDTRTHGRTWLTSLSTAGDSNIVALTFGQYKFKDEYSMLYVSQDGGRSWVDRFLNFVLYRASIGRDGVIVVGSNRILRTEDQGESWTVVKELGDSTIRDFLRVSAGDLYAAAAASKPAYESNGPYSLPYFTPVHDKSRPGEGGLFRSKDSGLTWTNLQISEDDRAIISLAKCCGDEVFALSAGGTIYAVQDDQHVAAVGRFDTTGTYPIALLVDEQRRAYVATNSDGVYRGIHPLRTDAESNPELPTGIALIGNYPNPFDQQTTFRYELPRAMHVKLTVFDMLGRELDVLVDALSQAGTHEAVFDASALPSGVYIYRLAVEGSARTGNMTLLRSGSSAGR